jgi:hypothetical protein
MKEFRLSWRSLSKGSLVSSDGMVPERRLELHRKVTKLDKLPMSGERLPTNALLEMSTKASFVRENKADGSSPEKVIEER